MNRRKHERKLVKTWPDWGPLHAVHNAMKRGDSWIYAWTAQTTVTWPVVERRAKISMERLTALHHGAMPTDAEIDALAALWKCPPEQIRASIAFGSRYV